MTEEAIHTQAVSRAESLGRQIEELMRNGVHCVAFSADAAMTDFALHPVSKAEDVMRLVASTSAQRRLFVGVAGLVASEPSTVLAVPVDAAATTTLARAYAGHIDAGFRAAMHRSGMDHLLSPQKASH